MPETFVSFLPVVVGTLVTVQAKRLYAAANAGKTQVVKNLTGTRSGIRYRVPGHAGTWYTASAPGEYPASASGALRSEIQIAIKGDDGYIGSTKEYSIALEKKDPMKGGREWLRPSLEQARPEMLKKIMERWM